MVGIMRSFRNGTALVAFLCVMAVAACGGTGREADDTSPNSSAAAELTTTSTRPAPTTSSTSSSTTSTTTASTTSSSTNGLGELPPGNAAAGEELFNTPMPEVRFSDSCSTCHSEEGQEKKWGPVLQGIGDVAGDRVEGMSALDYLQQSIIDPRAYTLEGWDPHMPTNYRSFLTDQEIADLIAFLVEQ